MRNKMKYNYMEHVVLYSTYYMKTDTINHQGKKERRVLRTVTRM